MKNQPLTQAMIDEAKTTELTRAGYELKAAFMQWSKAKTPAGRTIDCELHVDPIVDDEAKAANLVTKYKVRRTQFFRGMLRISRAEAERLLAGGE